MKMIDSIKATIDANIKANGKQEISGAVLNGVLKVMAEGLTTPSGDPMHYNYIEVGAEYNNTNAVITKTDYYGNSISHLPSRWYVEGLGDVTNEEMRSIYETGKWWIVPANRGFASHSTARAILPSLAYEQVVYKAPYDLLQAFNNCSNMDFCCQGSPRIKCIYGIIDASAQVSTSSFWIHTAGLIEIRLFNIKKDVKFPLSKDISKASILYIIENEAVASAASIILHADAYARLSADADITAALAAHPKVTLAKA